jgi:hypothetical protein
LALSRAFEDLQTTNVAPVLSAITEVAVEDIRRVFFYQWVNNCQQPMSRPPKLQLGTEMQEAIVSAAANLTEAPSSAAASAQSLGAHISDKQERLNAKLQARLDTVSDPPVKASELNEQMRKLKQLTEHLASVSARHATAEGGGDEGGGDDEIEDHCNEEGHEIGCRCHIEFAEQRAIRNVAIAKMGAPDMPMDGNKLMEGDELVEVNHAGGAYEALSRGDMFSEGERGGLSRKDLFMACANRQGCVQELVGGASQLLAKLVRLCAEGNPSEKGAVQERLEAQDEFEREDEYCKLILDCGKINWTKQQLIDALDAWVPINVEAATVDELVDYNATMSAILHLRDRRREDALALARRQQPRRSSRLRRPTLPPIIVPREGGAGGRVITVTPRVGGLPTTEPWCDAVTESLNAASSHWGMKWERVRGATGPSTKYWSWVEWEFKQAYM